MATFVSGPGGDARYGGSEPDQFSGQAGDDHFEGGGGDDVLSGGEGNDSLVGEGYPREPGSADRLDGGPGDDLLIGDYSPISFDYDHAVDMLRGGTGADTFLFGISFQGVGGTLTSIDRILDFQRAEGDRIHLLPYESSHPLVWRGAVAAGFNLTVGAAFGGLAAPGYQGVYSWTSGAVTYLIVDVDWSLTLTNADFVVALEGAPGLAVTDLVQSGQIYQLGGETNDSFTGTGGQDLYFGYGGADSASGLGGADQLNGGYGADGLDGGDGNDVVIGDYGDDTLFGGAGDDIVVASKRYNGFDDERESVNLLYGGSGADTLLASYGRDTLDGGTGDDLLQGINGGSGDHFFGGDGADTLLADGSATLDGGAGDDVIFTADAAHLITGGTGADSFSVRIPPNAASWTTIGFSTITDFKPAEGDKILVTNPWSFRPMVFRGAVDAGFSLQLGQAFSAGDYGPGFNQVWTWWDGHDTYLLIDADGGMTLDRLDHVLKFAGQVAIEASAFPVTDFTGFATNLGGAQAPDLFAGTGESDTYYGLGGADQLHGAGGYYDYLYGNEGDDQIWGDAGDDWLYGGRGADVIEGGEGADRIQGGAGADTLRGGDGADNITAGGYEASDQDDAATANRLYGEAGDDSLQGASPLDELYGGAGADSLSGPGTLFGGLGGDSLYGNGVLYGEDGDDWLTASSSDGAGSSRAMLFGGDGNDYLSGTWGPGAMVGGAGRDTYSGGFYTDVLNVDLADGLANAGSGDDTINIADTPAGAAAALAAVSGESGRDVFVLLGGLSASLILDGGEGEDLLDLRGAAGAVSVDLSVTAAQQTGMGNLALRSFETILAGDLGAVLTGDGAANTLIGGGAADTLNGGAGLDKLTGGGGDDRLDGGAGADTAVFSGLSTDFSWTRAVDGSWTVSDLRAGAPAGIDVLTSVEGLQFNDRLVGLLPASADSLLSALLRASASAPSQAAYVVQLAGKIGNGLAGAQLIADVIKAADRTTSVATMSYEFFTGKIPREAGVDYLVSPAGPNPNNLNSAYYQSLNIENRYINFAVNLGKLGEGKDAFAAKYGALSLFDATREAYRSIFGGTPTDAKTHVLIDFRAEYFAYYGGDGPSGLGTKAAMVGWLLAEAAKADLGVLARSNDAWLADLADGSAPFEVDILAPANGYWRSEFVYAG